MNSVSQIKLQESEATPIKIQVALNINRNEYSLDHI